MEMQNLRRFGQRVAEERDNANRSALASVMVPKSAEAKAQEALAWSKVTHRTHGAKALAPVPSAKDVDADAGVLGPTEHVAFLDEAVEASFSVRMPTTRVATAAEATKFGVKLKTPLAKVTGLRRRTRKGTVERVLSIGGTEIVISPLDWASVLAVMLGKTGKTVVNAEYSFGRSNSEDVIRIRSLRGDVVVGEISITALNKLI